MTREELIANTALQHRYIVCTGFDDDIADRQEKSFISGAKWADEHPDSKHTYTKQQLIDMGFAFTTNGDIVMPDQLNENLKRYLKYQKQKFIDKVRNWLETHTYDDKYWTSEGDDLFLGNLIDDICKYLAE